MPSSCKDIREAVIECLRNSPCIAIEHRTPSECIRSPHKEQLPLQCLQLLHTYGQCKRGMVDMRKRFRGNAPPVNKASLGSGQQLYGGKPLYQDVTSMDEETARLAASGQAPELSESASASSEKK